MELFDNLIFGFSVAFSLQNLLYCLIGVTVGTLIGVLPGIGPLGTIAILMPITYGVPPVGALIMLAGIYYGAQYGGSTPAILGNLPGETPAGGPCLGGHQVPPPSRAPRWHGRVAPAGRWRSRRSARSSPARWARC